MPQTACCVTTTHTCVWLNSQRAALHTSFPSKKVANLNKKRHSLIVSWPCMDFNGIFKKRSYPVCSRGFAPPPSGSYRRTMKKYVPRNKKISKTKSPRTQRNCNNTISRITKISHGIPATALFAVRTKRATPLQPRSCFAEISHGATATALFSLVLQT